MILEDFSSNGTFVNQNLVGKNKKVVLQNNDEIALAHSNKKGKKFFLKFYDVELRIFFFFRLTFLKVLMINILY